MNYRTIRGGFLRTEDEGACSVIHYIRKDEWMKKALKYKGKRNKLHDGIQKRFIL
jgi:hypothetical protein